MSDNIELNLGAGGAIAATDEVDGVHFQKVKLDLGGDGVSVPVAGTMPISGTVSVDNFPTPGLTDEQLRAAPVLVEESGPLLTLFIRLLNLLGAPVGYDKSLLRYRQTTVIEQGTITVVNQVNSVTNQVAIGGIQGQILVNGGNLSAWQSCVRARIT